MVKRSAAETSLSRLSSRFGLRKMFSIEVVAAEGRKRSSMPSARIESTEALSFSAILVTTRTFAPLRAAEIGEK